MKASNTYLFSWFVFIGKKKNGYPIFQGFSLKSWSWCFVTPLHQKKCQFIPNTSISCDMIPLLHGTKQVRFWSNRGSCDNYTVPRINLHSKRVVSLTLDLVQLLQLHQQRPGRTIILKPSSVLVPWITEPPMDSWLMHQIRFVHVSSL